MKLLGYVNAVREATENEGTKSLLDIMYNEVHDISNAVPHDDRNKIAESFTESLGWDPTTYYTVTDIEDAYDTIIINAPANVQELLEGKRNEIVERVHATYDELSMDYIAYLVAKAIQVETGWFYDRCAFELAREAHVAMTGEDDGFEVESDLDDDENELMEADDEDEYENIETGEF